MEQVDFDTQRKQNIISNIHMMRERMGYSRLITENLLKRTVEELEKIQEKHINAYNGFLNDPTPKI